MILNFIPIEESKSGFLLFGAVGTVGVFGVVYLFASHLVTDAKERLRWRKGTSEYKHFALVLIIGLIAVVVITSLDLLMTKGTEYESETVSEHFEFPYFLMQLLALCFLPGIFEEMMFRGLLQRSIEINHSLNRRQYVALGVGFFFSLVHMDFDVAPFIFRWFLGWFWGQMAMRTDSLYPTVAAHMFNNLLTSIIGYTIGELMSLPAWLLVSIFILGIISLAWSMYEFFQRTEYAITEETQKGSVEHRDDVEDL